MTNPMITAVTSGGWNVVTHPPGRLNVHCRFKKQKVQESSTQQGLIYTFIHTQSAFNLSASILNRLEKLLEKLLSYC